MRIFRKKHKTFIIQIMTENNKLMSIYSEGKIVCIN